MEKEKNNLVLVPTDFTEVGNIAIEHAVGLAKLLDYKVVIFHVINKETKSKLKKAHESETTIIHKLDVIAKEIKTKHKVVTDHLVREGSIFSEIADVADEIGANIIVLGTHGKIGVQHLVGSYALKVVTSSPVPVIVVQNKPFDAGYMNIVLPLDDTLQSKQKVKWATYIAKQFKAQIHIITPNNSDSLIAKKVQSNLTQIKGFLEKNEVEFTEKKVVHKGGNFAKQVVEYADSIKANLIAIMTNQEKLVKVPGFILGQWDEEIIYNSSKIPVMCVNPRDLNITVLKL